MSRALLKTITHHTPTAAGIRASVAEAAERLNGGPERPLDDIAAELGGLMAETVFGPLERIAADHRRFRERMGIGK